MLVVEDEPYLAEAIRDGLRLEAIAADIAGDGDTALEMLSVNTYDLAVLDEGIHALQHAMFCITAALFWWGLVYGRYGRLGYGASVFYVFTTVVHTGLLGAVLTLSQVPLYPLYASRAPDPLNDQQLAGLLMWVPAGLILTVVGVALFASWMGEANRRPDPSTVNVSAK